MTATAFLLLAALALAVHAIEELRAIYARAETWAARTSQARTASRATPPASEQVIATIQLRRGRLVLVRRRA